MRLFCLNFVLGFCGLHMSEGQPSDASKQAAHKALQPGALDGVTVLRIRCETRKLEHNCLGVIDRHVLSVYLRLAQLVRMSGRPFSEGAQELPTSPACTCKLSCCLSVCLPPMCVIGMRSATIREQRCHSC